MNLQTDGPYERLHCYVSLAGGDHRRWYPDSDHNQATDESFEAGWGGRVWNIAPFLSGDSMPLVVWPEGQPVPFSINCVGVAGGGLEAVNLGSINTSVEPAMRGAVRRAESAGGEGRFAINYLVSRVAQAKELDPNMTSPTNARIYPRDPLLLWDYTPGEDEAPIDGFAILLNDTFQWSESASARRTHLLPLEWLTPPCGDTYTFTVVAFYGSYPAGT